jgi:hypothetical protein
MEGKKRRGDNHERWIEKKKTKKKKTKKKKTKKKKTKKKKKKKTKKKQGCNRKRFCAP